MDPTTIKSDSSDVHSLSSLDEPKLGQRSVKKAKFSNYECTTITLPSECRTRSLIRDFSSVDRDYASKMQLAESPCEFHHMLLPDLTTQKELVSKLTLEQGLLEHVDEFSLENMAAALYYSGISSYDEMSQLSLKIIPPGPVFHTWYAYHGLTLFDGVNNDKKLDYIKLIDEEASRLSKKDIPLLLIYTNNSMTEPQIKTMNSLFVDNDNVLVLSVEEDLSHLPMVDGFKDQKTKDIGLMDRVRVCAIVDAKRVLKAARHKAKKISKEVLLERLSLWEDKSLTYSDIDNVFIKPRVFQIAANGFCNMSHLLSSNILIAPREIEKLPKPLNVRAELHNAHFHYLRDYNLMNLEELEKKSERLFRYLLSGSAHEEYQKIKNQPSAMEIWDEETNYYSSSTDLLSEEDIEQIMSKQYPREAFFKHLETLSHSPKNIRKLSRLVGIQQLRLIKMNYHGTWKEI
ncbi:hypothetical protein M3P05_15925 [Sansalvadorimonas sp. 2012CJ34-2]|uniref:Uncharacterized protein n=1 Tax=Parendozoicomonas callyspongiae TaxID=2942213 RepID=A0ABT0PJ83_9GAMM|nr:hypothetical protein [Sansalvadorimonas sp. 2012CJ34-2]MCL6271409.1 hypothetical protein [Sansalvadorimonas sp. 2012CJ34-2]